MGNFGSLLVQAFPPAPRWKVEDIPDLTGQITIVTGGNCGIGKATIKALLQHNAKVYMASRSRAKAEAAIEDLKNETGKTAIFLELDLADLASVRKAADEFISKEAQLHVLFNNGGLMWPEPSLVTKDGYDLQFGTNVVGHWYLTKLLIPLLLSTAQSSPEKKVRVITTSSSGHYLYPLNWDSFRDGPARQKMTTYDLYSQSKFGNVVIAKELQRRYGDKIFSASLNPGNIKTELLRSTAGIVQRVSEFLLYPASYGALTQLWAGTSKEALEHNGKFLIPWARVGVPRRETLDPKIGARLWQWLEDQVEKR